MAPFPSTASDGVGQLVLISAVSIDTTEGRIAWMVPSNLDCRFAAFSVPTLLRALLTEAHCNLHVRRPAEPEPSRHSVSH